MANRWSNPSGGLGIHRFRVWPLGSDSYSHVDLTANFDKNDAIIGIPSSGDWPPSQGVDGGIYKEVTLLQSERLPIGTFIFFFRPSLSVPIPAGFAVCDGSVIASSNHDFPGIAGSVTLPNMLNAFPIGADPAKTIGAAGDAVNGAGIETAAGAPGPQGTGGLNKIIQTIAQLAAHDHGGATSIVGFNNSAANAYNGQGTVSNDMLGVGPGALNGEQGNHAHTIPSQGSSAPMENRPRYVGLIPLCKVKRITTL